jgi:hypothetical protein
MPARLREADPGDVAAARARLVAGEETRDDLRLLVKHALAVLQRRAPGGAVEVRVPPYSAIQVIGGTTHQRGTPPAVVETDAATWLALAFGDLAWADAVAAGRVTASGERSDLTEHLPLIGSNA